MTIRALFAVRSGDEDWQEQLITENPAQFDAAEKWARANGFDRFRVVEIDPTIPPQFAREILT